MPVQTNKNVLFIQDNESKFDSNTQMFIQLFKNVDKVASKEDALKLFDEKLYDIVIGDISVEPKNVGFLKQIKDIKKEQIIFALVAPQDSDKLYKIADLNINAFELTPDQFDQALEAMADFDPNQES